MSDNGKGREDKQNRCDEVNSRANQAGEHGAGPAAMAIPLDESAILLRQIDNDTGGSPSSGRKRTLGLPTVSIDASECVENGATGDKGRQFEGDQDFQDARGSQGASTTSEVNSCDDAASIASRLSQIADEQEFILLKGESGSQMASASMGNLLIALDGRPERHKPAGQVSRRDERGGRSASAIAVNCLAADESSSQQFLRTDTQGFLQECAASSGQQQLVTAANESENSTRTRTRSFAGPSGGPSSKQACLRDRRNESSGSLCGRAGVSQPERGNLKSLESSRQQAALAMRARAESVGGSSGGGTGSELVLNIRRSTWKLDEFEQAFKPQSESASQQDQQQQQQQQQPRNHSDSFGSRKSYFLLGGAPSTRNLLFRSFKRAMPCSADKRANPAGQDNLAGRDTQVNLSPRESSWRRGSQTNLLLSPGKPLAKRRMSHHDLPPAGQRDGKSPLLSAGSFTTAADLTNPRRGSAISFSSIASSFDSARSARPFGKLAQLLSSPHHKRRAHAGAQRMRSSFDATGGDSGWPDGPSSGRPNRCCSCAGLKRYLPVLEWLPAYEWRKDLWPDLAAGLAVAVLNISTSLSAAVVAETDLGVAFRTSIVNTLVYALLCSSRHASFGSWSIMSQMLLDSVRRALSDELILSRINLGPQASWSTEEYEMWHMNIIVMYTFLIGLVQLAGGLLNLGNLLASFIPEALCSSMIAATAFTMAVGQLANMCGTTNKILWALEKNSTAVEFASWADLENSPLSITDLFAGLFRWIQQVVLLVKHHEQVNLAAVLISVSTLCLLIFNQYYLQAKARSVLKKQNLFLPFEMILLVLWICVSYLAELRDQYHVTTCGPISIDFGTPNLPNLRLFRELWFDSLATALISYTMVFIMARDYSNKFNYEINNNQELIACGAGNLIGGLFDALPATASFSRTAGQVEAGGRTQMASLVNCLALTLVVQFFGHHVAQLPVCVMSATLFFGFVRMMSRFQEVFVYWRICKVDFAIWLVTFCAILTLDLVTGFVYGFIFSILTMLYRAQNRRCYLLGTIGPSADVYVPLAKYPLASELEGIKVFQFCGPIHYVCADLFERLLRQKTRVNVKQILKQHQQQLELNSRTKLESVFSTTGGSGGGDKQHREEKFDPRAMDLPTHVILDFSMISFIDSAGIRTIKKIIEDFQRVNITIMLASLASHVAQVVKSEPSLWQAHKDRFYVTLADAVQHALRDNYRPPSVAITNHHN